MTTAFQPTVQVEEDDLEFRVGRPQRLGQLAADITTAARYDDSGVWKRTVHISLPKSISPSDFLKLVGFCAVFGPR